MWVINPTTITDDTGQHEVPLRDGTLEGAGIKMLAKAAAVLD